MREASVHHKERGGKSVYEYVTLMRSRERERERERCRKTERDVVVTCSRREGVAERLRG
jgi:hypothetical protein